MAVPKRKVTKSRQGMRRSHDQLKKGTYIEDPQSGEARLQHHIDPHTGIYRGRKILIQKNS